MSIELLPFFERYDAMTPRLSVRALTWINCGAKEMRG